MFDANLRRRVAGTLASVIMVKTKMYLNLSRAFYKLGGYAAHIALFNPSAALLATALLGVRMMAEERLLKGIYPEYADYACRTCGPFCLLSEVD